MSFDDAAQRAIEEAAAAWLARRDRGLTSAEQDAYLQWLREDSRHGRAVAALDRSWRKLDLLREWRPEHSAMPNPDLLAPGRTRRWWRVGALAAAACLAVGVVWLRAPREAAPARPVFVQHGPDKLTLEDGSLVELNTGANVEVRFSPSERRVRLLRGDAHFTVAKNPARPFFVTTDRLKVRALGTAFAVLSGAAKSSVLVTEGRIGIVPVESGHTAAHLRSDFVQAVAGQEVDLDPDAAVGRRLQVRELTPAEMDQALSWRALRLEFANTPLRDAVAELNRFNPRKLAIADDATGEIRIAGSFRADNPDAFVRLLDAGFNVTAERRGDETVLRRRE